MATTEKIRWSSRFAFLLAAVGSAVGLANIWRFPFTAGVSGGGAFVIIYLGAVLLLALPLVIAELTVGRRGAAPPPRAISAVARESGHSPNWGWMGVILGGFMPLILDGGGFWPPFALAIAGGTVLTTVLSFFLVPAAFRLFALRRPFEASKAADSGHMEVGAAQPAAL